MQVFLLGMEKIKIPSCRIVKYDSFGLLKQMLECTDLPCSITICSYAITESYIKRLLSLKNRNIVTYITLILDYEVMNRHREKVYLLQNIADELYFTDSHAKLMLVENKKFKAVAIMSANATQNYRIETYYVTNRREEIREIKADLSRIISAAHCATRD